ncbi:MAG: hypothetical protein IPK76_03185 [Lewinellaceae bacterium]|nr:hypothetical protein [Lewinellaceae bacterium]
MSRCLTFLSFLFFFTPIVLIAQSGSQKCLQGFPASAAYCNSTCMSCDMHGLEDVNNVTPPVPPSIPQIITACNNGAPFTIENPRWYSFIAGTNTIIFNIRQTTCQTNDGLEAAIVEDCGNGLTGQMRAFLCERRQPFGPVRG